MHKGHLVDEEMNSAGGAPSVHNTLPWLMTPFFLARPIVLFPMVVSSSSSFLSLITMQFRLRTHDCFFPLFLSPFSSRLRVSSAMLRCAQELIISGHTMLGLLLYLLKDILQGNVILYPDYTEKLIKILI